MKCRWHWFVLAAQLVAAARSAASTLTGTVATIPQGTNVNLTVAGPVDWVHWGLYTESTIDRKANVPPLISNFIRLYDTNGYAYIYRFNDNFNGYTWSDGIPTAAATNTPSGIWAYGVPQIGSGFRITAPADTVSRTLKVYVGAFAASGRFTATLSDNSAAAYTDNFFNQLNGESRVYSITYAAQSAGQTLTIEWVLESPRRADGNVTLQAAALSAPGANNPPIVAIDAPGDAANFIAGSDITVHANANDYDGTVTGVEFFANGAKIGQAAASPFSAVWTNAPPGGYALTARAADNGGTISTSAPVEIFVNSGGGSLTGNVAFPSSSVGLTGEGSSDWAHWGLATPASFDHKAAVTQQISNFSVVGATDPGGVQQFSDYYTAFDWSDGTPTAGATGTQTGVFTYGFRNASLNGFLLTAPAGTNSRTLKVYVGLYGLRGKFQAYLSDFSAPAYTDTSLDTVTYYGNDYGVYTLDYAAASAGQTLIVRYTANTVYDGDFGNVTLASASLSGAGAPSNAPPMIAISSPASNAAFAAPATIVLTADAHDTDGTVSLVEYFNGGTKLGDASVSPYTFTWTNVPAGTYSLTARATDDSNATTLSDPVMVSVTNTPSAVVLENAAANGAEFLFSFMTEAGSLYTVQSTDSLSPPDWQQVTNFTGAGTRVVVTNTMSSAERFYRVETQ